MSSVLALILAVG